MPVFELTAPDGKVYEVEGPDAVGAVAALKKMNGATPPPAQRGVWDQLTGATGPRYQTWPEKMVRGVIQGAQSAVTLPGDVYKEATQPQPSQISDSDVSTLSVPRAMEFASLFSPVNPAVRAGDRAIPGVSKAMQPDKPVVPTAKELVDAGASDIKAGKASDLRISPDAIKGYSQKIQNDLFGGQNPIHPIDAPNTFAKLKELEAAEPGSFFTPQGLQTLREHLGATAQNFNEKGAKDQLAASRAIKQLDEFLPSLDAADVVAGAPAATGPATKEQLVAQAIAGKREADRVAGLFERGRGNYAAGMRSNDISGNLDRATTGILERAEGRAQATNSGRNIDNTIRSKVASVLERPKELSGLNEAEITALEGVRDGGVGRNTARYIANLAGGGGGGGQTVMAAIGGGVGASVGGVPGAIAGAAIPAGVGAVSKTIANRLAKRDLRGVDELLRQRSPLFRERVANPTMSAVSPEKRAAIARILMQMGLMQEQQPLR